MSHRLYGDLAWLWPIVSPPEHYVRESEDFVNLLRLYGAPETGTLLHLGCGGGHNDFTFKLHYRVTGVDLSEQMLAHARALNPDAEYVLGDMRNVRLGRTFTAVTALDSINYILTEDDLRAVFATAHAHLEPGGLFLTYVEECVERFQQNKTVGDAEGGEAVDVAFIQNLYDPDPSDTTYEAVFLYLIRRNGALTVETDVSKMGLFPLGTWIRLLLETGFDVKQMEYTHEEGSFPVLVGVKTG